MGYCGGKSQEEKEKMCRVKCRRGNSGCTFTGLSCLETLPSLPFGLLPSLTDEVMSPLILQQHSPLQKLGNRVLALVFLVTSPILPLPQICQSRKILLKLPEQIPTSPWAGEMEAAEKQEVHGLF